MPALSLRQPWAWAIFRAGKDVENRDKSTGIRGRFAVQAAKNADPAYYLEAVRWMVSRGLARSPLFPTPILAPFPGGTTIPVVLDALPTIPPIETLPRGVILGTVELVDVAAPTDHDSGWHMAGQHGYRLREPRECVHAPASGMPGWFVVPKASIVERARLEVVGPPMDTGLHSVICDQCDKPIPGADVQINHDWRGEVIQVRARCHDVVETLTFELRELVGPQRVDGRVTLPRSLRMFGNRPPELATARHVEVQ